MNTSIFKRSLGLVLILFICFSFNSIAQEEEELWQELRSRPYPQWFKDAKLGIFIHWGLYSVPAYGGKESYAEWYLRGLQLNDSLRVNFMKQNYGPNFTYNDFAQHFKAELFDPAEWASLFRRSGAKYIIMVSKHHDGYCLWPSNYARNWNSVDVGPKRDLVGDLTTAVRKEGLKMGLYYSLPEWNHPLHMWYADPHRKIGNYVDNHMIPQFKELISAYKPAVLFTDGEWYNSAKEWHAAELISWYYDLVGDDAIVNNRWGGGSNIGFLTPEYSSGIKATDRPWAEVRGLGRSFGLNRNEPLDAYMTGRELIHFFSRAVAHGGGIIINVGPGADGQIPLLQQERLLSLGNWLEVNGEAIYGATTYEIAGEEREISLKRIDPKIDFNWVRNTPVKPIREDDFTATWEGFIEPEFSEEYTFEADADDGMKVWIDGKLLINMGEKAATGADGNVMENETVNKMKGAVKLKAGKRYAIKAAYFEKKQNAKARLYWESKSRQREIVPGDRLFLSGKGDANGLQAEYRSMQEHIVYTNNNGNVYAILLEWPDENLELSIAEPGTGARISLVGRDGDLPWKYANNKLVIDLSGVKYNEMPTHDAWVFRIKN